MAGRRRLRRPLRPPLALRLKTLLCECPGDVGDDAPGLAFELSVGEAQDGAAGGVQIEFALVVGLEGDRAAGAMR